MADGIENVAERVQVAEVKVDHLTERVQTVGVKVDHLTERVQVVEVKVDQLSSSVDQRFNAVDEALVEQRQYSEFCYERLEAKMDARFERLEAKMDAGDARLEAKMDGGFGRLERKLDQFIDVQRRTNELVDRRLRALEP